MTIILLAILGVIYMLLVQYAVSKCRPLQGVAKNIFKWTSLPILFGFFFVNMWISFNYLPDIMTSMASGHLASSGKGNGFFALITSTPLPMFILWLWYQLLHFFQPKYQTDLKSKFQIELGQLSPDKIEIQNSDPGIAEAIIIRPKESSPISEYFFIVVNGSVVAALKSGEFTKITLNQENNEIGCYAKPSNDNFNNIYKLNFSCFKVNPATSLELTVTPDIFVGSCISKISSKKAKKYQSVSNYIEQGPRPNNAVRN